jgi:hypothetical protein
MSDDALARWEKIFPWIESQLGGRIIRRERQGRESGGRFAWFVDLDVDGQEVKTYVRGTRDDSFSSRACPCPRSLPITRILRPRCSPM